MSTTPGPQRPPPQTETERPRPEPGNPVLPTISQASLPANPQATPTVAIPLGAIPLGMVGNTDKEGLLLKLKKLAKANPVLVSFMGGALTAFLLFWTLPTIHVFEVVPSYEESPLMNSLTTTQQRLDNHARSIEKLKKEIRK